MFVIIQINHSCSICTAGKDRTGIVAAILLKLAGVDNHLIAKDYSLTRVGREPDREKVLRRLMKEPMFAANAEAAMRLLTSRYETMIAFFDLLEEKYGGVETYVKTYTGLTDEDLKTIRSNLVAPTKSRM